MSKVEIVGNNIKIFFDEYSEINNDGLSFDIGENLMKLTAVDTSTMRQLFLSYLFFSYSTINADTSSNLYLTEEIIDNIDQWLLINDDSIDYNEKYLLALEMLFRECPYAYFYLKPLKELIFTWFDKSSSLNTFFNSFADYDYHFHNSKEVNDAVNTLYVHFDSKSADEEIQFFNAAVDIVMQDMKLKIERLREEISILIDNESEISKFTSFQKMFYIDETRIKKRYINKKLKSELIILPVENNKCFADELVVYTIENFDDLIALEIYYLLKEKANIRLCKNCGNFFIVHGHKSTVYCDRKINGSDKTCKDIGAMKNYRNKKNDDPIFKAYNKAYKTKNARIRYETLTKEQFKKWSEKARKKREECYENKISFERYVAWLDSDEGIDVM